MMEGTTMNHPTQLWLRALRVHHSMYHPIWRPLLLAMLLTLVFLVVLQTTAFAASHAATEAAAIYPLDDHWRFVDESKPGAPAAAGQWAATTAEVPTEVVARFTLSSTMQASTLQLHNSALAGQALARLDGLDYCTHLIDSPLPYAAMLQLNIDADVTDGDRSWQGRLVYVPADNGAVIQNEWQCWDTLVGKWWATSGPVAAHAPMGNPQPLGTLLAHFPNLGVHPDYSAVVLKAGPDWSYFQGEASPVSFSVDGAQTFLAFDVAPSSSQVLMPVVYQEPTQASQPENATPQEQPEVDTSSSEGSDTGSDEQDNDKSKDEEKQRKKDKKSKEEKAWEKIKWDDLNWDDFDGSGFNWTKVDWESIDWENLAQRGLTWKNEDLGRDEAIRLFIADVEQCSDERWEDVGFDSRGECVAYYIALHISLEYDWGEWYQWGELGNTDWGNFDWSNNRWNNNRDNNNRNNNND
jgi:hypothetical protein